ncbi:MAG: universal stress protein [Desulfovibrio sp.]|jgi:nucleotide-binding universal stress UspA family protein|nr:universal stress protein [Desulfovibrio sp.]
MDATADNGHTPPSQGPATDPASADSPVTYRKILIPVSGKTGGRRSTASLRHALALHPEEIVLLHVTDPIPGLVGGDSHRQLLDERRKEATATLAQLHALAEAAGVPVTDRIEAGTVAETIVQVADEIPADLIVMFTDGVDRLEDLLLGTTTERVLRGTDIALLAVRR